MREKGKVGGLLVGGREDEEDEVAEQDEDCEE